MDVKNTRRSTFACRQSSSTRIQSVSIARPRSFLYLLLVVTLGLVFGQPVNAGSIPYPLSFFTLTNTNADGTAISFDGGVSVVLTGGNNGSGLSGTTDLLAIALGAVTIDFQYIYSSLDSPGVDQAGYLVGAAFTQVADTDGQSGSASFSVSAGDVFGFRVATDDNTGEPGVFTISDFSGGTSAVPEPSPMEQIVLGLLVFGAAAGLKHFDSFQRTRS